MSLELYIFGSAVRGEVSGSSDIDVLAIASDESRNNIPSNWSIYSPEIIKLYFLEGRLFAWHLYLEAVEIFPKNGSSLLSQLGSPHPYMKALSDIDDLEILLRQALNELKGGTESVIYELGIAYTAIRDIAMSASWSLLGRPTFSRNAPYLLPVECPIPYDVYQIAMLARHASMRGIGEPQGAGAAAQRLVESSILHWVENIKRSL